MKSFDISYIIVHKHHLLFYCFCRKVSSDSLCSPPASMAWMFLPYIKVWGLCCQCSNLPAMPFLSQFVSWCTIFVLTTHIFLAVQDSSISNIVGLSVCLSQLIIRAYGALRLLRDFWETFERPLRAFWETFERLLRDFWETFERLLRDFWETFERLLRDCWETFERLLRVFSETFETLLRQRFRWLTDSQRVTW